MPPPPGLDLARVALFFDIDGTLVEIEQRPDDVHVPDAVLRLLQRLEQATDGAIALVSGRSLTQIDDLFAPLELSAAGLHGLERRNRRTGEVVRARPDEAVLGRARARLARLVEDDPRLLLEDKGATLALHYRRAPERAEQARAAAREAADASAGAFVVLEGKMVFELKPPHANKGAGVAAFMAETPFRHRMPVFVGDDVTDEAGFEAVRKMGGLAIRVGEPAGQTLAERLLPDVSSLRAWLEDQLAGPGGPPLG